MDIHIDLDQLKFLIALIVSGALYGNYVYKKGLMKGWDDLAYELEEAGIIKVDEETGEITSAPRRY